MIKLDKAFLAGVGLGDLPPAAQQSLLASAYRSLEESIGRRIAQRLTEDQIDALSALIDHGNEPGALALLDQCVPDHREIVRLTVGELTAALAARAPEILAAETPRS